MTRPDNGEHMGQIPLLLIHRNQQLVQTLSQLLNDNGFAVTAAPDGVGVETSNSNDAYKVIVVDPNDWPNNGPEMLQRWRRAGISAHVVVISDNQSTEAKVRCFDLGADDYLSSPFDPQELLARLRVAVRRTSVESNGQKTILKSHDLVIDVNAGTVKRGDKRIELTPREFALLRLLAMRKGRPVTRTTIWEILYDKNSFRSSNVVDVYVRRLRVKIDKNFEPPLIVTRFGQGYMLRNDEE